MSANAPRVARTRWRLRCPDALKIARFESEALVFNPVSWQTHLLNATAMDVLDALLTAPQPLADLAAAVAGSELAAEELAAHERIVEGLLVELEGLGLVQADAPTCA